MGNEKLYTLIKAPIITEQTASLGENLKQVVFKVDLSANKREIKQAVEELFKVEVLKVTTSIVKGKTKRNTFQMDYLRWLVYPFGPRCSLRPNVYHVRRARRLSRVLYPPVRLHVRSASLLTHSIW